MLNKARHCANRWELNELQKFLKKWEYRNVNSSRYFFSGEGNILNLKNLRSLFLCKPEGSLKGLLLKGPYGLFLPVFSESLDFSDFGIPVQNSGFRTLMGTGRVIRSAELWFSDRIRDTVNYRLMCLKNSEISAETDIPGITIRQAGPSDARNLFPLQKAYELEEVILNPSTFNPLLCMENLKRHLKHEVIFLAEKDGKPVAKGGTNARGLYFAQLGGIYTLPELRNLGISRVLVSKLIKFLLSMNLTACLFAKPDNLPALKVYRRCGLEDMEDFRISYLDR